MFTHSIWKYVLKPVDEQSIIMPKGAKLLSVARQFGDICLWVQVETEAEQEPRGIVIVGTGHPAPPIKSPYLYVGTVLLSDGNLVLHVFDAGAKP